MLSHRLLILYLYSPLLSFVFILNEYHSLTFHKICVILYLVKNQLNGMEGPYGRIHFIALRHGTG